MAIAKAPPAGRNREQTMNFTFPHTRAKSPFCAPYFPIGMSPEAIIYAMTPLVPFCCRGHALAASQVTQVTAATAWPARWVARAKISKSASASGGLNR